MKFTVTYELALPDWDDLQERALYHEVDAKGALFAIQSQIYLEEVDTGNVYLMKKYVDNGEVLYYWDTDERVVYESGDEIDRVWTWYMNDEAGHGVTMDVVK